jgi:hypothetical protein
MEPIFYIIGYEGETVYYLNWGSSTMAKVNQQPPMH